jgi:hypothetical protein
VLIHPWDAAVDQVASRLAARASGRDTGAAGQQQRRLARIGTWRPR